MKDDKEKFSSEERLAAKQCIEEAFWNRSLPMAISAGSLAFLATKMGKFQSKSRFGSWPIVVGFGSLGYVVGKFSYITSEKCMDIFLEKAPQSSISENVRERREANAEMDVDLPYRFMDIMENLDVDQITEKEEQILEDCNSVAFYRYSLPLSAALSGAAYFSMKGKLLTESRILASFPRLPKSLLGSVLGYILGQYLYVKSGDCPLRFQKYDAEGQISRLLRGEELDEPVCQSCQTQGSLDVSDFQDYVLPMPESGDRDLEARIRATWTNSFQPYVKPYIGDLFPPRVY